MTPTRTRASLGACVVGRAAHEARQSKNHQPTRPTPVYGFPDQPARRADIRQPEIPRALGSRHGQGRPACDDITNLSTKALFEMGDAAAHAVWVLAKSKTGLYPDGSHVARQAKAAQEDLVWKGHTQIR